MNLCKCIYYYFIIITIIIIIIILCMKEWAVHTGRFREGIEDEDWVSWKTRLRCALNKAADIVERKNESHVKAEDVDPYKVYEFIPRQPREYESTVLFLDQELISSPVVIFLIFVVVFVGATFFKNAQGSVPNLF